jgi:S1-C subfamily serine protease
MPLDDDGDDDAPVFGSPLPPDDRLWRHPSELGPAAMPHLGAARSTRLWGVAVVSGLVGAVLTVGVVAAAGLLDGSTVVERPALEQAAAQPSNTLASFANDNGVVSASRAVSPAIVRLQVVGANGSVIGSGVLYRSDGYLLTSAHLLEGAQDVAVRLADGAQLDGAVIGADAWTDVAVVKVDRADLATATIGSTGSLEVGEQAIAISAPAESGTAASVTVGVISGKSQHVTSAAGVMLQDMLETDAPLATESTGGALVDRTGSVVGIIAAAGDTNSRLGWATPIEVASTVGNEIISTGKAPHVWLGVEGDDLAPGMAKQLNVDGAAVVSKVADGSPAAVAGLQQGDVITAVDGRSVLSMSALVIGLRGHQPGDVVIIDYVRDGSARTCHARVVEKPQPS